MRPEEPLRLPSRFTILAYSVLHSNNPEQSRAAAQTLATLILAAGPPALGIQYEEEK